MENQNKTTSEEEALKALKLLLYRETEKNQKLRQTYKEVFGVDFVEENSSPAVVAPDAEIQ